jgi:hypothetical protein
MTKLKMMSTGLIAIPAINGKTSMTPLSFSGSPPTFFFPQTFFLFLESSTPTNFFSLQSLLPASLPITLSFSTAATNALLPASFFDVSLPVTYFLLLLLPMFCQSPFIHQMQLPMLFR